MTPTAAVREALRTHLGKPYLTVPDAVCQAVVVAVLRACREPSEGMIAVPEQYDDIAGHHYVAHLHWPLMIDALIEEVTTDTR